MTAKLILIAEPRDFSERALKVLQGAGEVRLHACNRDELAAAFRTHDVVWVRLGQRIDQDVIGSAPRCGILACPATGLDHIDLEHCARHGVHVVSLRGETEFLRNVRATAELALALTLALVRMLPAAVQSTLAGQWNRDAFRGHELFEKCAGIVGVGRLGTIVASYFRALGMRVLGYDVRDVDVPGVEPVSLDELLSRADVVSLHVSYGPATHHLIGRRELALMKRSAVLVNTARGAVIDEEALLKALRSGSLAGAALDVLEGEPHIRDDHRLIVEARNNPRLIIVPHLGGSTHESLEKAEAFVAEKVAAALRDGTSVTHA